MGRTTLQEFKTRLQKSLGDRTQADSELEEWINDGYQEVASVYEHSQFKQFAEGTVSKNDSHVPVPEDCVAVKTVVNLSDDERMLYLEPENYMLKDKDTTGDPEVWTKHDNSIHVWPTPDEEKDLKLVYLEEAEELELDSDITRLPAQWDRAVSLWALFHALTDLGEVERADRIQQKAMIYMRGRKRTQDLDGRGVHERGLDVAREKSDLKTRS